MLVADASGSLLWSFTGQPPDLLSKLTLRAFGRYGLRVLNLETYREAPVAFAGSKGKRGVLAYCITRNDEARHSWGTMIRKIMLPEYVHIENDGIPYVVVVT